MRSQDTQSASIRDVARHARVSAATASRALRGNPAVADATRDRVLQAARELAYSLPSGPPNRPSLIGLLTLSPARWYYAAAIAAVEHAVASTDHQLVLCALDDAVGRAHFFERVVPENRLDGLIVLAVSFDDLERRALSGLGIPVVTVGRQLSGHPGTGIDDEAGARLATRHLIGLGHRNLGVISFDPLDPLGESITADRLRGFESAVTEAGLRIVPEWNVKADARSTMNGGVRAAEDLLSLPAQPSAIFAMSDELAIGALRTLRRAGIDVPLRVSVIGFDDHEMADVMDLTTIEQPVVEQAQAGARTLLELLGGAPPHTAWTDLPTRLVVRGTTGPADG